MNTYDVKAYGAKPDGQTVNTDYNRTVVDDCAKNGWDFPQVIGSHDAVTENIYFDNCKFTVKGRKTHTGKIDRTVPCFKNMKNLPLNKTSFDVIDDLADRILYEEK